MSSQDAAAALIQSLRQSHPDLLAPPAPLLPAMELGDPAAAFMQQFEAAGRPTNNATWFGGRDGEARALDELRGLLKPLVKPECSPFRNMINDPVEIPTETRVEMYCRWCGERGGSATMGQRDGELPG